MPACGGWRLGRTVDRAVSNRSSRIPPFGHGLRPRLRTHGEVCSLFGSWPPCLDVHWAVGSSEALNPFLQAPGHRAGRRT